MSTTTDVSLHNHFARLSDELIEKIFILLNYQPSLTADNHVRLGLNSYYFDYLIQKPLLKQTCIDLLQLSLVCRRFYQIIKSSHFWERKCREDHVILHDHHFPTDFNAYDKLNVNNPFHLSFNLLEDRNWRKSAGTTSRIELRPPGAYPLYDEFNRVSSCRVTSHTEAQFTQRDISVSCKVSGSNEVIEFLEE